MTSVDLIPVPIGDGVVVLHTPAEWARFMRGVDVEACAGMAADLEEFIDNEPEDE